MTVNFRVAILPAALAVAFAAAGAASAQPSNSSPAPDQAPVQNPAKDQAQPAPTPAAPAVTIPPPPPGKGQVVFYRPFGLVGAVMSFHIHENGKNVGHLGMSRYRIVVADPGKHRYEMSSEAVTSVILEVDAGETYYVRQTMSVGLMLHHPNLQPSDEAAFQAAAAKLKPDTEALPADGDKPQTDWFQARPGPGVARRPRIGVEAKARL